MERQYGAEDMVVVAAGDVQHDAFVRQVEAQARQLPRQGRNGVTPQHAHYIGGDFREERDLMDAQIVLGFEGRAYHVRDFYASQVLSMILGGGMSSRLFQEVREKRGLCYSVYAFHWGFSDTGIFGVHAATGQSDIAELVPVIISELQKTGEHIDQSELDRARAQYRAGLIMSAESCASRASQIARQLLLFGRPIGKDELMEPPQRAHRRAADRPVGAHVLDRCRPSPASARSARWRPTRRSATRSSARSPVRTSSPSDLRRPAMIALPFFRRELPALKGQRVSLRMPVPGDYREWAALRAREPAASSSPGSRAGPPTNLTGRPGASGSAATARTRRRAAAAAFFIFENATGKLVGGITLGNIRYGVAQTGANRLLDGRTLCRQGLHARGAETGGRATLSRRSGCTASRPPVFPTTSDRSACLKKPDFVAKDCCDPICESTASGTITISTP